MYELKNLKIDEELRNLIPPLSEEEFTQLEKNIIAEGGITEPIVVYNGYILDGHHRYEILNKHPNLKYAVVEKDFDDKYKAMAWACTHQLGRRNLSDIQKTALLGRKFNAEKLSIGEQKKKNSLRPQNEGVRGGSSATARSIATEIGVSKSTVERAAEFVNGLDAAEEIETGISKEILSGKIKTTKKDVSEIGKANPTERKELVKKLRVPLTPEEKQKRKEKKDFLRALSAVDQTHIGDVRKIDANDTLNMLIWMMESFISSSSDFYNYSHEIMSNSKYKARLIKSLSIVVEYIDSLKEGKAVELADYLERLDGLVEMGGRRGDKSHLSQEKVEK